MLVGAECALGEVGHVPLAAVAQELCGEDIRVGAETGDAERLGARWSESWSGQRVCWCWAEWCDGENSSEFIS